MAKLVYYTSNNVAYQLDGITASNSLHPDAYWTNGPYLARITEGHYDAAAALMRHYLMERCDLTTLEWNTSDKYQEQLSPRDCNVTVGMYMLRIGVCYAMCDQLDAERWFDMASVTQYHYDRDTIGEDGTDHIFALHYNYVHRNEDALKQLFALQKQLFGTYMTNFFLDALESNTRYKEVFGAPAFDQMFSLFPETYPRPSIMAGSGGGSE